VNDESKRPPLSHASGAQVTDNLNIQTAGPRGPALLQDATKRTMISRRSVPGE